MASRDPSPAPSSSGDTLDDQVDDSRLGPPELPDIDDAASDLPARTATPGSTRGTKRPRSTAKKPRSKKGEIVWSKHQSLPDATEDEATPVKFKKSDSAEPDTKGTAVGTRRQANGTVGSVYSGSKIRHIKKPDGVPLWRKEIQYAFLNEVVSDETRCFTRLSDGQKECTFAEIYIDSMARSSKTSKILKDRLHVDKPAAQNMAMICLLVNVGRMNTTLNFFPEMRAQLRTYHPIPALQAYPTQRDYKSLQDAPRLKSILKGASEDEEQPKSLPQLRSTPIPRSNPVNLIFVLSQAANEISQMHFLDKIDFFDLAIRPTVSSHSRAVAFLWLMWWYLESDFTKEAALKNPFGTGEYKEGADQDDPKEVPMLVPTLVHITEEEGDAENVDTEIEIEFGEKMTKERLRINAKFAEEDALNEQTGAGAGKEGGIEHKGVKRLKRSARELDDLDTSDVDSRASPGVSARMRSPAALDTPAHPSTAGLQADSLEDDWEPVESHPGRGRYKRARGKGTPSRTKGRGSDIGLGSVSRATGKSRLNTHFSDRGTPDTLPGRGTPQPHPLPPGGVNHPILSQFPASRTSLFDSGPTPGLMTSTSKSRARTGYQRELEHHKQRRVDWLVNKKRRGALKEQREKRENQPCSWLLRAAYRIESLDATYDSDEDETALYGLSMLGPEQQHGTGLGGIITSKKPSYLLFSSDRGNNAEQTKKEKDDAATDAVVVNGQANKETTTQTIDLDDDPLAEESEQWKRTFQRASRRLFTWSGEKDYTIYLNAVAARANPVAPTTSSYPNITVSKTRPLSRGDESMAMPASSIANSTPRKHETRKSLDDEITQDLLAERSADEGDEEDDDGEEDIDADGDTMMGERQGGGVLV